MSSYLKLVPRKMKCVLNESHLECVCSGCGRVSREMGCGNVCGGGASLREEEGLTVCVDLITEVSSYCMKTV